jgi:hypothetical protein
MTLQELKNKNYVFSNIKDNDLIRIFNDVLKLNPEIKNMNYDLDLNSVYRVIYSKVYIDWFINKKMSNNKFSNAHKCDEILTVLREFLVRASKLKGFGKEVSYINENIMKFRDYLNDHGIVATIRRELGSDIDAACGQLRRKNL